MSDGIEPSRRVVLRVVHDVDEEGKVVHVQLEPLPDAPFEDIAWAAWQAARRRHPWIIGDHAAEQLKTAKTIALAQVHELMIAGDESLLLVRPHRDLHDSQTFRRLRDALTDLRGYMPALNADPSALAVPATVPPPNRSNWFRRSA